MLVLAELNNVIGDVSQLQVGKPIVPRNELKFKIKFSLMWRVRKAVKNLLFDSNSKI